MNSPHMVSQKTVAKVSDAVLSLGYTPDLVARSLVSRQSNLVAALVPAINSPIFGDIVQGMSEYLRQVGMQLMLGDTGYSVDAEYDFVNACLARRVDGVILTGTTHSPATRDLLERSRIPVVETWSLTETPIDMVVGFSSFDAAKAMVTYLCRSGRRCIGFVSRPIAANERAAARRAGYLAALREAGLPERADLIVEVKPTSAEGGEVAHGSEAIRLLKRKEPQLDGIFCAGDHLAVGVLLECARSGWRVPDDLGVAGFGNHEIGAMIPPGLTTIRTNTYHIGRLAAERVYERLTSRTHPTRIHDVGFELIIRGST